MGLFDFLSLAVFAGLIVLFLQRSIEPEQHRDHLWQYMVAAIGCAITNYLANNGYMIPAVIVLIVTLAFIVYVLRPFGASSSR